MKRTFDCLKFSTATGTSDGKAAMRPQVRVVFLALLLGSLTAACGGGGSQAPGFTVGGTITGLTGSGLVLFGLGTDLSVSGSSFTFANSLTNGTVYAVTVNTQPTKPSQTCVVENGSGTIADRNITSITVNCTTNTYSLGGTVSGLTGAGLVLSDGAGATVAVAATNTTFRFPAVASGVAYTVAVTTQPASQTCTVSGGGTGTVTTADINTIAVSCVAATSVSGPTGAGLVQQNRATENLAAVRNGDSLSRFAYVAAGTDGIYCYSIDTLSGGVVSLAGDTPCLPPGVLKSYSALSAGVSGKYLYATDGTTVGVYAINGSNGALTYVSSTGTVAEFPGQAVIDPAGALLSLAPSVAVDPSGQFAYVTDNASNVVSAYAINGTTEKLTAVPGSSFAAGTSPTAVAVDPSGRFVYVANASSNNVSAYALNSNTGALTTIAGSPFAVGTSPSGLTVHPSGRFLYVTHGVAGTISALAINSTTGALTAISGSPFAASDDANSGAIAIAY